MCLPTYFYRDLRFKGAAGKSLAENGWNLRPALCCADRRGRQTIRPVRLRADPMPRCARIIRFSMVY